MNRPLSDLRPIGPFTRNRADVSSDSHNDSTSNDNGSLSDSEDFSHLLKNPSTPESLFIDYIKSMSELHNKDPEEFAKSVQARNYARSMGIEDQVYKK